ncbi:MAG: C39 family peptidase, partial [Anaerolineae bacterium]|nr:C39 family peptidase [Anaerolineae bacterium]
MAVIGADNGVSPLLQDVVDFAWSPDGAMIAARDEDGALSLWKRATGERTAITEGAELLRWIDERTLAYTDVDGIYSVDVGYSADVGSWARTFLVEWESEAADETASMEYTPVTLDAPWRTQFEGICGGTNCGPSSLGISMEYLGVGHSNDTIRRAINVYQSGNELFCSSSGTTYSQLRWYATDRAGLEASSMWVDLTIDDLMAQIEQGHPMVVLAHYRSLPGHETSTYYYDHFIVFQGIRQDGLVSYDDPAFSSSGDGSNKTMTQSQFMTAWSSCVAGNPQQSGMVVYGNACTAPGLTSPADSTVDTGPDRTVAFSWDAPGGCAPNGYRFRVKTVSDMETGGVIVADEIVSGVREASIGLDAQWDNGDLYWSVQACAPCTPFFNGGPWAPMRHFRLEPVRVQLFDGVSYGVQLLPDLPMPGRHVLASAVNNRVESIIMPAGTSVRLFKDDLRGPHVCIQGSDSSLWDDEYDDGTTAGNSASWLEAFTQPDCPAVHDHFIFVPLSSREEPPVSPCVDLVVNGGFETDEGWFRNNGAVYSSAVVHSGARSMLVANSGASYVSTYQSLSLPAGEAATLHYWLNSSCIGCDPGDKQYVWVKDDAGAVHYLLPFSQ